MVPSFAAARERALTWLTRWSLLFMCMAATVVNMVLSSETGAVEEHRSRVLKRLSTCGLHGEMHLMVYFLPTHQGADGWEWTVRERGVPPSARGFVHFFGPTLYCFLHVS